MLRLNEANVAKLKPRATTYIEYDVVCEVLVFALRLPAPSPSS
jgi:hypothetical protein